MTEDRCRDSWPAFYATTDAIRRVGRDDIAAELRDALLGGATSTEILGRVGLVLRVHDTTRARLTPDEKHAWDAVMHDVNRQQPPRAFAYRLLRLLRP